MDKPKWQLRFINADMARELRYSGKLGVSECSVLNGGLQDGG